MRVRRRRGQFRGRALRRLLQEHRCRPGRFRPQFCTIVLGEDSVDCPVRGYERVRFLSVPPPSCWSTDPFPVSVPT